MPGADSPAPAPTRPGMGSARCRAAPDQQNCGRWARGRSARDPAIPGSGASPVLRPARNGRAGNAVRCDESAAAPYRWPFRPGRDPGGGRSPRAARVTCKVIHPYPGGMPGRPLAGQVGREARTSGGLCLCIPTLFLIEGLVGGCSPGASALPEHLPSARRDRARRARPPGARAGSARNAGPDAARTMAAGRGGQAVPADARNPPLTEET
jgi:hypothetical protein